MKTNLAPSPAPGGVNLLGFFLKKRKVLRIAWNGEKIDQKFVWPPQRHLRQQISASGDGGLCRGTSVGRPGSEDPHRRYWKFSRNHFLNVSSGDLLKCNYSSHLWNFFSSSKWFVCVTPYFTPIYIFPIFNISTLALHYCSDNHNSANCHLLEILSERGVQAVVLFRDVWRPGLQCFYQSDQRPNIINSRAKCTLS